MTLPFIETILRNETAFLFILVRSAAFLAAMPMIGGSGVPTMVKAMIVLSISFVLFQVVKPEPLALTLVTLATGLLGEVLIGAIIGLGASLLFGAVEIGAELIGIQMGFGAANLFDPISNHQASLIGRLEGLVAMLIFLGVNGHYILIEALMKSFEWVPSAGFYPSGPIIQYLMRLASKMFLLGLKISIPVIVALLMANVTIGIFSRVIPQLNVLLFSFPVTITLGLIIVGLSLPIFVEMFVGEVAGLRTVFTHLLMGMRP